MNVRRRACVVGGLLLGFGCASSAGTSAGPVIVGCQWLANVDPLQPVALDALAPPRDKPSSPPPGVVPNARGGVGLQLVLAGAAPVGLELHDLGHEDGDGPCYAVHGVEGGAAAPSLGVFRVAGDGGLLAVPVQQGTSWRVVLAERRDGAFHEVASTAAVWQYVDWPTLAPDRRRLAFWAVDGSAPGGSSATVVERRGERLAVVDRVAPGLCKHWPSFTADGRLVVRVLVDETGDRQRLVIDGVASRDYTRTGTPLCSPDGRHVAAAVRRNRRSYLWIDGHELGPFADVGNPRFLGDDLLAVVVRDGATASWCRVRVSGGASASRR